MSVESGIPAHILQRGFLSAASASGGLHTTDELMASLPVVARRLGPQADPEKLQHWLVANQDMMKTGLKTPEQATGYLLEANRFDRTITDEEYVRNVPRAILNMTEVGVPRDMATAIVSTIGQRSADSQGRTSGTAGIAMAKYLQGDLKKALEVLHPNERVDGKRYGELNFKEFFDFMRGDSLTAQEGRALAFGNLWSGDGRDAATATRFAQKARKKLQSKGYELPQMPTQEKTSMATVSLIDKKLSKGEGVSTSETYETIYGNISHDPKQMEETYRQQIKTMESSPQVKLEMFRGKLRAGSDRLKLNDVGGAAKSIREETFGEIERQLGNTSHGTWFKEKFYTAFGSDKSLDSVLGEVIPALRQRIPTEQDILPGSYGPDFRRRGPLNPKQKEEAATLRELTDQLESLRAAELPDGSQRMPDSAKRMQLTMEEIDSQIAVKKKYLANSAAPAPDAGKIDAQWDEAEVEENRKMNERKRARLQADVEERVRRRKPEPGSIAAIAASEGGKQIDSDSLIKAMERLTEAIDNQKPQKIEIEDTAGRQLGRSHSGTRQIGPGPQGANDD